MPRMPHGLRLGNPLNIELGAVPWFGQARPEQQTDPRYCEFVDAGGVPAAIWGLRAGVRILLTYRKKYRLRSIRAMIARWAPPQENPTEAYIRHVATTAGVRADEALDDATFATILPAMLRAMVRQEQGQQPFTDAEIAQAIALA